MSKLAQAGHITTPSPRRAARAARPVRRPRAGWARPAAARRSLAARRGSAARRSRSAALRGRGAPAPPPTPQNPPPPPARPPPGAPPPGAPVLVPFGAAKNPPPFGGAQVFDGGGLAPVGAQTV